MLISAIQCIGNVVSFSLYAVQKSFRYFRNFQGHMSVIKNVIGLLFIMLYNFVITSTFHSPSELWESDHDCGHSLVTSFVCLKLCDAV